MIRNKKMPSNRGRLLCGVSAEFDSSRWIKISKGLDDFRFGPPSPYAGRIVPASPAIVHESSDSPLLSPDYASSYLSISAPTGKELSSTLSASSKTSLSMTAKDVSVPTVKTPIKKVNARTKQKKHVQSIEQKLKENPLILFPYLESDIPHEVFEKLMSILGQAPEPQESCETVTPVASAVDMKPSGDKLKLMQSRKLFSRKNVIKKIDTRGTPSAQAVEEAARHIVKGGDATNDKLPRLFTEEFKKMNEERGLESNASVIHTRRVAPLDEYRSFLKRINYSSDKAKKKARRADLKTAEESLMNVRQVAEDFCNWMQTIGGEDAKFTMDVDKVLTLFAMNAELESMQTTSNVLDVFPLTPEETEAVRKPKPSVVTKTSTKPTLFSSILKVDPEPEEDLTEAQFVRYRYGAWYLDINEWKKLKPGEILEDPQEAVQREKQEAIRCSDELDRQLSTLHTYKELTSFIRRNNMRLPNFLQYVKPPSISTETFTGKIWSPGGRKKSPHSN